jgi:serine/threonine-protein kinase
VLLTLASYVAPVQWPDQAWEFAGAAVVAAGIALAARPALLRRIDEAFPYIRATDEYVLRRKLEVYRAALDLRSSRGDLDALAGELRLRPRERALLDRLAAPAPAATGAPLAGRYRVEGTLAPGVYGRVLLAWDARLGERVVLKEYAGFAGEGASVSFAREAKALGELEHPHVIAVRDVFRSGDDLYVALEHAAHGSLEDRLAKEPRLAPAQALAVLEQVLDALAAAHARGIVHRDVKPANVLFAGPRGDVVKLADFGLAQDPLLDRALRAMDASAGTLAWMAPEQALGQPASPATDVFAAGALLHRMVAGKPWTEVAGLGEQAARRAIAERAAPRLQGVPPALAELAARALAKDPADRFPDAGAMLKAVRRLRAEAPQAAAAGWSHPQPYGA